jgi:hypothetical protein
MIDPKGHDLEIRQIIQTMIHFKNWRPTLPAAIVTIRCSPQKLILLLALNLCLSQFCEELVTLQGGFI